MMQIGLALHNYEMAYEVLPPGTVNPTGPIDHVARGYHVSWIVQMLPYLEQANVYKNFDFAVGVYDARNAQVRQVVLSPFLCPSVPAGARADGDRGAALSTYAACHNDVNAPIDSNNNGVFYLNSSTRYRDITDGSSQTIFIGEKLPAADEFGWASGTRDTLRNTGTRFNMNDIRQNAPGNQPVEMVPVAGSGNSRLPAMPANGFASAHSGGAQFGFGDGSVRFLSENVDFQVYQQLGHRADGKLILNDF
jgi:prepilin-type processing-associated H-X9-DG protein